MDVKLNNSAVAEKPIELNLPSSSNSHAELSASVVDSDTLSPVLVDAMYALYSEHYADTAKSKFITDLNAKTHVLLLQDCYGVLCGFTTVELYDAIHDGNAIQIVFSGDTIIDPRHWGNNVLAFEWLRFIGKVKRKNPTKALHWLLIVKGHRTYRYLSTFALRYTPHHSQTACPNQTALLNTLAAEKFGACFDATTGIARFGEKAGRLNSELATISMAHGKRAAVGYFLERNPGYKLGDELVCLCELSEDNMRPLAKRIFLSS